MEVVSGGNEINVQVFPKWIICFNLHVATHAQLHVLLVNSSTEEVSSVLLSAPPLPSCRWATPRRACEHWPRCSTAPSARACPPSSPAGTTVWTSWKAAWPIRPTWIQSGTSTSVRFLFFFFFLFILGFTGEIFMQPVLCPPAGCRSF